MLAPTEHRACKRRPCWLLVNVTDLPGARVAELTNLRDLSERGVAFYTNTRLKRESIITLELNVPVGVSGGVIPASARVARITRVTKGRYLVGAEFTEMATRDRVLLRRVVDAPYD